MKTESVIDELRAALDYNDRTTLSKPQRIELDPDWYTQFREEIQPGLIADIGESEYEPDAPVIRGNWRPCITFCDIPVVPHIGPLEIGYLVVM